MDKKHLRLLVAENDLENVTKAIVKYTEDYSEPSWHNQAVALSAQLAAYENDLRMGSLSEDELKRSRNRVIGNILGLIDDLPEDKTAANAKTGVSEEQLKTWIGLLLFFGKLILLFWALFHIQTGGFSKAEGRYTIGYLIPIFAAYLAVIVQENVRNRFKRNGRNPLINKSLIWMTFILIPTYIISLWLVISARAKGDIGTTEDYTTWLTIIESGLGIYVGTIVFELFNVKRQEFPS